MERARRAIRLFLVGMVVLAVMVGLIYYFHDVRGVSGVSEGTLIVIPKGSLLWR